MGRLSKLRVQDPVLTSLAIGYKNNAFVGEALFPFAPVDKEGGKIPVFGMEEFKVYATLRALRAKSNRIQPEDIGSIDVVLDEHDLEYPIDYREDAESAFPLQAHATNVVTQAIMLRREKMIADMAQDLTRYGTGNKITLTGTDQFTDPASDPEGVVADAKDAVADKIIQEPNTMVIGQRSWKALKRHPKLKAILSDTRSRLVQLADLREIFEIENIVVGNGRYVADDGTAAHLWGDNIVLAYVPGAANGQRNMYEPSYGYTLRKKGWPQVDTRTEDGKLELVRNTDIFRPYMLGPDAGYLIHDTNA